MRYFKLNLWAWPFILGTILTFPSCSDDDDNNACIPDSSLQVESSMTTMIAENHHRAYTDIVIDAPITEVWAILTDFDNMPSWSTSLQGISGDISNGGQVIATYLNQGQRLEIPHTLIYEEGRRFGWSDPTGPATLEPFGGFVDNHLFTVEAISECQTRFIQSDEFMGEGNATFNSERLANFIQPLYQTFNRELKNEVEN